ncbi:MAG: hypothetical protein R2795_19670 [Saprospiraceae bacterium]
MMKFTSFLLFFGLALVWWMWKRIRQQLEHLDDETIRDFLANRLEGQDLKNAREHLLYCDECKMRMDELTSETHKRKPERYLKRRF